MVGGFLLPSIFRLVKPEQSKVSGPDFAARASVESDL